jgi:hypothetical protein
VPQLGEGLLRHPQPRLRGHRERASPGIKRSEARRSAADNLGAAEHVEADNDDAAAEHVEAGNDDAAARHVEADNDDAADNLAVERSGADNLVAVPRGVPRLGQDLYPCP